MLRLLLCLAEFASTHASFSDLQEQSASLMQVKTTKGFTRLPLQHAAEGNISSPSVNSTMPEVMPTIPQLTEVEVESVEHSRQHKRFLKTYTLLHGFFFLLLSSAFVLTAWRAFTLAHKKSILAVGVMVIVLWFAVGAMAFMGQVLTIGKQKEGLTMIQTAYLCIQILTTVGYGDLTPSTPEGRLFVCAYVLSALVMVAALISELCDYLVKTASRDLAQGLEVVRQRVDALHGAAPIKGVDEKSATQATRWRLLRSILYFAVFVLAGTLFYGLYPGEDKSIEEALYMSIVTLSTIGFGDEVAKTEAGRAFGCIWMLLGVSSMANMVSEFAESFLRIRQAWTIDNVTSSLLQEMDQDGDGKVTKSEFLHFTLLHYGLVSKEDMDAILAQFDALDRDESGFLDSKDLELFQRSSPRELSSPGKEQRRNTVS